MIEQNTQEQLQEARRQYADLFAEQGNLDAEKRRVALEHDGEMREAARGGGGVMAAVQGMVDRLRGVEDRERALPFEVHYARLRVAELERDVAAEQIPEAEAKVGPARKALVRFESEEVRKFEAQHQQLNAAYEGAHRHATSLHEAKAEAERVIRSLEAQGPQLPTLPESIN